jgi:hypothetical protein
MRVNATTVRSVARKKLRAATMKIRRERLECRRFALFIAEEKNGA